MRLRKKLADAGLDAGPDTIGWHLAPPPQRHGLPGHHRRHLTTAGLVVAGAEEAPEVLLHPVRRPSSPTRCWQSDFTHYRLARPTADRRRHRDPDLARRPLPLRALGDRPPPGHRPDRAGRVPRNRCSTHGIPASTLTDNGMVFTTRLSGGKRRPQRLRDRAAPPRRGPEELPPQPPHHLRQGRAVPADPEEVAARPTRPAHHHRTSCRPCSTPSSTSTTTTGRTGPCRTGPPRPPPTPPAPRPPPATATSDTHDRVRPDRVDTSRQDHPAPRRPALLHRHRPNPRPNPRPRSSSRTSTSASSTPPPANSSANSPSTPPSATKAPDDHPDPPRKRQTPEPTIVGSGVSDVLRHHMVGPVGIEPTTRGLKVRCSAS